MTMSDRIFFQNKLDSLCPEAMNISLKSCQLLKRRMMISDVSQRKWSSTLMKWWLRWF